MAEQHFIVAAERRIRYYITVPSNLLDSLAALLLEQSPIDLQSFQLVEPITHEEDESIPTFHTVVSVWLLPEQEPALVRKLSQFGLEHGIDMTQPVNEADEEPIGYDGHFMSGIFDFITQIINEADLDEETKAAAIAAIKDAQQQMTEVSTSTRQGFGLLAEAGRRILHEAWAGFEQGRKGGEQNHQQKDA